jgi:hypothetical protein
MPSPILVSMLKYRDIIHTYRDSSARAAGLEVFEELVLRGEPLAANAARVRLRVLVRHRGKFTCERSRDQFARAVKAPRKMSTTEHDGRVWVWVIGTHASKTVRRTACLCANISHTYTTLSLSLSSLSRSTHRLSPLTLKLDAQGGMLWYIPALAGMGAAGEGRADRCCERGGEETAAGMLSALEACLLQSQVSRPESARALAASRMLSWPSACLCM